MLKVTRTLISYCHSLHSDKKETDAIYLSTVTFSIRLALA